MNKISGILLESDYAENERKQSMIRLWVRTRKGLQSFTDSKFRPYFYVIAEDEPKTKAALEKAEFGERKARIRSVEIVKKENAENVLKLSFDSTSDLIAAREEVLNVLGVKEKREYDIPFVKRYLLDKQLEPCNGIELECEESNGVNEIHSAKTIPWNEKKFLKIGAWDIETYSTSRFPDPKRDPIIMIALSDESGEKVYTWGEEIKAGKKWVDVFATEKAMIQSFVRELKSGDYDIILTYNGDLFAPASTESRTNPRCR